MTGHSLVWSDGCWGEANALQLPLNDRGLLLADGLFETVLVLDGRARLLEPHLERWRRSAALLGLPEPPQTAVVQPLVEEAIARCNLPAGHGALRLNWSAGSGGRGLDRPDTLDPRFWLQLSAHTPTFAPVQVIVSRHERRNGSSRLSHCKTFAYGQAVQARREARGAGAEDALLLSTSGELCCGTAANL
ncbi:MAG: aminotransferase class IV, partial [Vulcanococcus sp.]